MRWLARSVDALPAGLGWLCPAEAARAEGLRFPKRRTEFLLRRMVAKHAVAAIAGLPASAGSMARIEIGNQPGGAPYALLDGVPTGFDISLTDRAGWAVCLVGEGVGGDLEVVEPRSVAFVRDFLTEAEQAYVRARPEGDARHAAANLIWSAKESALKVLRTGLRLDTREVEVTIAPGRAPAAPIAAGPVRVGSAGSTGAGAVRAGAVGGWRALSVRCAGGAVLRGWWRRDRAFLLTAVAAVPAPVPTPLEHPAWPADAAPIEDYAIDQGPGRRSRANAHD